MCSTHAAVELGSEESPGNDQRERDSLVSCVRSLNVCYDDLISQSWNVPGSLWGVLCDKLGEENTSKRREELFEKITTNYEDYLFCMSKELTLELGFNRQQHGEDSGK